MKKILLSLTLVLALLLVGCQNAKSDNSGEITVVVAGVETKEYQVNLDMVEIDQGLFSVLKYLSETQNLALEYSGSGEFLFLTKVGSVCQNEANSEYVYIYTTVESDFDVVYGQNVCFGDLTLTSSGVGVTQMTILDGATYYIGIVKW